jgi:hypothetical protein
MFSSQTANRKSVMGGALTALAPADPYLVDDVNTVDVELVDEQQWMTSCDDAALADGSNLAVLGGELIQFGQATPLGEGRFRLSHLLRARGGTEWASHTHAVDELFCLMDSSSLRSIALPIWLRGSMVTVAAGNGATTSAPFAAESVRPLAPENPSASYDSSGNLVVSWTRRSRSGFAWLDEVDAPIGESREQYRITIAGSNSTLEFTAEEPSITIASSDLPRLGVGTAVVEMSQLGDWAASRPAQLIIQLS